MALCTAWKSPIGVFLLLPFNNLNFLLPFNNLNFYTKREWKCDQKKIHNKTPYVWSNKFTPAKETLHNRWLWWLRHLEGLAGVWGGGRGEGSVGSKSVIGRGEGVGCEERTSEGNTQLFSLNRPDSCSLWGGNCCRSSFHLSGPGLDCSSSYRDPGLGSWTGVTWTGVLDWGHLGWLELCQGLWDRQGGNRLYFTRYNIFYFTRYNIFYFQLLFRVNSR